MRNQCVEILGASGEMSATSILILRHILIRDHPPHREQMSMMWAHGRRFPPRATPRTMLHPSPPPAARRVRDGFILNGIMDKNKNLNRGNLMKTGPTRKYHLIPIFSLTWLAVAATLHIQETATEHYTKDVLFPERISVHFVRQYHIPK